MNRRTLSVEQAASVLGVSRSAAYRAVHAGEIPTIRIGRRVLVLGDVLERMLTEPTKVWAADMEEKDA